MASNALEALSAVSAIAGGGTDSLIDKVYAASQAMAEGWAQKTAADMAQASAVPDSATLPPHAAMTSTPRNTLSEMHLAWQKASTDFARPESFSAAESGQQTSNLLSEPVQINSLDLQEMQFDRPAMRRPHPDSQPRPLSPREQQGPAMPPERFCLNPQKKNKEEDDRKKAPQEKSSPEGWTFQTVHGWLVNAQQLEGLHALATGRRLVVVLPLAKTWRDAGTASLLRRICVVGKNARGIGQVAEFAARWWLPEGEDDKKASASPSPCTPAWHRWCSWRVHRQQTTDDRFALKVSSITQLKKTPLSLRLQTPHEPPLPAPAASIGVAPSECLDILDARGFWRQLGQQWSFLLIRSPLSLKGHDGTSKQEVFHHG
jgi:hypothetical protein